MAVKMDAGIGPPSRQTIFPASITCGSSLATAVGKLVTRVFFEITAVFFIFGLVWDWGFNFEETKF